MSNMGFVFTDKAEFSFLPVKQKSGNSAYQHEYHRVQFPLPQQKQHGEKQKQCSPVQGENISFRPTAAIQRQ